MDGFFRIVLGGAIGAVLGILFVKKQTVPRSGEGFEQPVAPPTQTQAPLPPVAPPAQMTPPPAAAPAVPTYLIQTAPAAPGQIYYVQAPPTYAPQAPAPVQVAPVYTPPAPPAAVPAVVTQASAVEAPPVVEAPPLAEAPVVAVPTVEAPVVLEAPPVFEAPVVFETPVAFQPPVAEAPAAETPVVFSPAPPADDYFAPEPPPAPAFRDLLAPIVSAETLAEITLPNAPVSEDDLFVDTPEPVVAEAEVLLAPQVLDEPVPGSGWEPSAMVLSEEAELEGLLPLASDHVAPYEPPEVGVERPLVDDEAWKFAGWPEIAEAAVADSVASMPDDDWTKGWPSLEPEPIRQVVESAPEVVAAEPVVEVEVEASSPAPEPVFEEPVFEQPVFEQPVFERPAAVEEEPTVTPSVTDEAALGDDLKSRIEETRRRIREELEKPFAAVDDSPMPESPPPAPINRVAPPAPLAPTAPVIGEGMRVAGPAAAPAPVQAEVMAGVSGSDYDAMRARIELTRSRLKAKAFDAMMAGESALLGRDEGDDESGPGNARRSVAFDSEIEQTVDSTLREEDR